MIQILAVLVAVAGGVGLAALMSVINGWILSLFWVWFILPLFPTLPVLDIIHAIGLAAAVRVVLPSRPDLDRSSEAKKNALTRSYTRP
jgi:hypothetical protein